MRVKISPCSLNSADSTTEHLVHIMTITKKRLSLHWKDCKADHARNTSSLTLSDLSEKKKALWWQFDFHALCSRLAHNLYEKINQSLTALVKQKCSPNDCFIIISMWNPESNEGYLYGKPTLMGGNACNKSGRLTS